MYFTYLAFGPGRPGAASCTRIEPLPASTLNIAPHAYYCYQPNPGCHVPVQSSGFAADATYANRIDFNRAYIREACMLITLTSTTMTMRDLFTGKRRHSSQHAVLAELVVSCTLIKRRFSPWCCRRLQLRLDGTAEATRSAIPSVVPTPEANHVRCCKLVRSASAASTE